MPGLGEIIELLERDDALEVGHASETDDGAWPTIAEDEDVQEVDHGRLFPGRRPARDGRDIDLYGDEWEIDVDSDAAREIIHAAQEGIVAFKMRCVRRVTGHTVRWTEVTVE